MATEPIPVLLVEDDPNIADLVDMYLRDAGFRVYQAATGNKIAELASGGGHWNSPIVADGRIALPEGSANSHSSSGIFNIWRLP